MRKIFEIYFLTTMAIFGIVMFGFLAFLILNGIMAISMDFIFNVSLCIAIIGGFIPMITKALNKPS